MLDPADRTLLATLRSLAGQKLATDHACTQLLDRALANDDPAAARDARRALHDLPADMFDALMADAHRILRQDPAAILALWRGAMQ
jgi:hypothetical protein